jgi:DNA replication protein
MKKWYNEPFFDSTSWIFENLMHLNLSSEEALTVLMINYLNSKQIRITNDVLCKRTGLSYEKLDQVIALLCAKNYLDIKATSKTVAFQLSGLFESEMAKREAAGSGSLYDVFESEFGRPLTQNEMQMVSEWVHNIDSKLILYALKEASIYRSLNMNYIARILKDWTDKGISSEMVEEGKHLGRRKNS